MKPRTLLWILVAVGGAALVGMAPLAVSEMKTGPGNGSFENTMTTTSVPASFSPAVKASIPPPPVH